MIKKTIIFSIFSICILSLFLMFKSFTVPIFNDHSISSLETLTVNGDQQTLLLRGHDVSNPVILFLHGGPGMPSMYLAHAFQREMEDDFTMVQWDQRSSGKSYKEDNDPENLSISQLLKDVDFVVDHLRNRFNKDKVIILGHSHGTYLGSIYSTKFPEKVAAYIGTGQMADPEISDVMQNDFLTSKLVELGYPSDTQITDDNRETLLFQSHSEIYAADSFIPLIIEGLLANEYSIFDILNVAKGSQHSSKHMKYDVIDNALMDAVFSFEVPVYFVMGKHDMVTPYELSKKYMDIINAPVKKFYTLENSAHFPFYEEPVGFLKILREIKKQIQ